MTLQMAHQQSEGTGGYLDDTVVTTKVKSALLGEKNLKSTEISVETFKGRVQLSGFVSSRQDANRAVQITRSVPGVKSVSDQNANSVILCSEAHFCASFAGPPAIKILAKVIGVTARQPANASR